MANPNMIRQNSHRQLTLSLEEVVKTFEEAVRRKNELDATGKYHMVKTSRFKTGMRPCRFNDFKQHYSYAVRAYLKPNPHIP